MPLVRILATLAVSAILAFGAEIRGTWAASSRDGQNFAGAWTAEVHEESGGVTGAWTLIDSAGNVRMSGGWSASKSTREWRGSWRATIKGRDGEYLGMWTATVTLGTDARLADMLESALRAVVNGTWKTAGHSGAWSIRASP